MSIRDLLAGTAVPALLAAMVLPAAPAAAAGLIGDTVDIARRYPNLSTPYWGNPSISLTPAAGTADAVTWLTGTTFTVELDGDADTISFRFPVASSFGTSPSIFDGFLLTGFDHDIVSASVRSNDSGYAAQVALPTARSITLGLNGDGIARGGFVLEVTYETAPIPEPSTWALMAGGLLACGLARRRARR